MSTIQMHAGGRPIVCVHLSNQISYFEFCTSLMLCLLKHTVLTPSVMAVVSCVANVVLVVIVGVLSVKCHHLRHKGQ